MTETEQTTPPELTQARDIAQQCLKDSTVLILGSGASMAFGLPGMSDIHTALSKAAPPPKCAHNEWKRFQDMLAKCDDFEKVIDDFEMGGGCLDVSRHVSGIVWKTIAVADWQAMLNIAQGTKGIPPLSRLLARLNGMPCKGVDVVTTNYDRIAESSAEKSRLKHYTGFTYGHFRRPDEDAYHKYPQKIVRIWKVHGSIDWFASLDKFGRLGKVVALPTCDSPLGNEWRPAIILPGSSKYELTHREPFRTILRGADDAIARAKNILCVGFGFRDRHIYPELEKQCEKRETTIVILAKELSKDGLDFFENCQCNYRLVLTEKSKGKTLAISGKKSGEKNEHTIAGNYWDFPHFMSLVEAQEIEEEENP